jgi:hypothetical protein
MTQTVEDFLSGGGPPSAKFKDIGTTVKGIVESANVSQQTDFATGAPKTWDDGQPMMQLVVVLQTDDRDAEVEDDDGKRRLFVKGQMRSAVIEALKAAGTKAIEPGGTLAVRYAEDGEQKRAGHNAPKVYVAQYRAPAAEAAVTVDELL